MPMSTAATVTCASSPAARPLTLTGRSRVPRGRIICGAPVSTLRVRASLPIENQERPMARPGMRWARASSGLWASATT